MKKLIAFLACLTICISAYRFSSLEIYGKQYFNINPVVEYEGIEDENLSEIMVPILLKDRVLNKTGIQCVWSTLETLGRYAEEEKLIDLTDLFDCQAHSDPIKTAKKLNELKIKYEQTTNKNDRSLIIKSVVKERRGCLFAIQGHAMTLVHYDEKKGTVKYINNSDVSLKIRTWSMDEFNRRWNGWICVLYADPDVVADKFIPKQLGIPVIDRNNSQASYSNDYILQPVY